MPDTQGNASIKFGRIVRPDHHAPTRSSVTAPTEKIPDITCARRQLVRGSGIVRFDGPVRHSPNPTTGFPRPPRRDAPAARSRGWTAVSMPAESAPVAPTAGPVAGSTAARLPEDDEFYCPPDDFALLSAGTIPRARSVELALFPLLRAAQGARALGAIPQLELELPVIAEALARGWAVTVPDHGGMGGHFGVAREPGYRAAAFIRLNGSLMSGFRRSASRRCGGPIRHWTGHCANSGPRNSTHCSPTRNHAPRWRCWPVSRARTWTATAPPDSPTSWLGRRCGAYSTTSGRDSARPRCPCSSSRACTTN